MPPFRLCRRQLLLGLAIASALGTSGCFRPLYGPTASGERLQDVLASVEVAPISTSLNQERFGHFLRSDLRFDLDGSGQPRPKRYKLAISVTERVTTQVVDSATGRADSATLSADADYALTTLDGSRTLTSGKASGSTIYDRSIQRFATVRAARNAEMRAAKLLSEQIRSRLSATLLTGS